MSTGVYMPESGPAKRAQSQGLLDAEGPTKSRRCCSLSRRHCQFFTLVLVVVLFFYGTYTKEISSRWKSQGWMHKMATKWGFPLKGQRQDGASANRTGSSAPASEPTSAAESVTASTWPRRHTNASAVTQQTTQTQPVLPAPVPLVSPGPYFVEYPHEYHFIIDEPEKCEQQKPYLVLVVPVAPHNRADRDIIRSTWGSGGLVLGKRVALFFLLGLHTGEGPERLQEQLLQESKEHRDLIQSDFLDCYNNLTIKTMVMLEWLDSHCSSASYAMKIDSDIFLNLPKLISMLVKAPKTDYLTGRVERGAAVQRDPQSKWFLPVEVFPESQFPPYTLGLGYVLSLDLPKRLVEASRHVRAVYIEDVYVGLCMRHLGLHPTDAPDPGYFNVWPVPYSRCAYSRLIATTVTEQLDRRWAWKDFQKPGPRC